MGEIHCQFFVLHPFWWFLLFLVPPSSVSTGKLVFFLLLLFNHNYSKNGSPSIIHVYTTMLLRALSTNSVSSFITFLHNIVLWAISFPKSVLFPLSTAHYQTSFENTACQHAAALRPRRTASFVWIGLHLETLGCSKCGPLQLKTKMTFENINNTTYFIHIFSWIGKMKCLKNLWKITKHM